MKARIIKENILVKDVVLIFFFSFLMTISSQIRLYLFFTPVPITLQTLVLFLSIFCLRQKAFFSQFFWILLGIFGVPVFAKGGGWFYLFGPTGGYILGFLSSCLIFPHFFDVSRRKNFFVLFLLYFLINLWIYLVGVIWLKMYLSISFLKSILLGVVPFIPGDIFKIFLASLFSASFKEK